MKMMFLTKCITILQSRRQSFLTHLIPQNNNITHPQASHPHSLPQPFASPLDLYPPPPPLATEVYYFYFTPCSLFPRENRQREKSYKIILTFFISLKKGSVETNKRDSFDVTETDVPLRGVQQQSLNMCRL